MYRLVICDDKQKCREFVREQLLKYFSVTGETFELTEYVSGDAFLFHAKPGFYDIAFFDVEMSGTNGIETARRMRALDKNVIIIFTTAHRESVFPSFTAEPLSFLTKPLKPEELRDAVDRAVNKINSYRYRKFTFEFNKTVNVISVRDIVYFESSGRKIDIISYSNERNSFYGKLNELQTDPSLEGFIRCHQSYLVNTDYIQEISNNSILLTTGVFLPVKRGAVKEIKKQFLSYLANITT